MKVTELRKLAEKAAPDALIAALTEAYKKMPADKKPGLDEILVPLLQGKDVPGRAARPKVDLDQLEAEVNGFADDAYACNYCSHNPKISVEEQHKWYVKPKQWLKVLDSLTVDTPGYGRGAALYITLYQVLCRDYTAHLFLTGDPFHVLRYPQDTFLRRMVSANLAADDSPEMLSRLIHVICRCQGCDDLWQTILQGNLPLLLDTPERRETALQQAMQLSEAYIQRLGLRPTGRWLLTLQAKEDARAPVNLADMVLQIALAISPKRYLSMLDFYYAHSYRESPEAALDGALAVPSIALQLASGDTDILGLRDAWIQTYQDALKRGIQPSHEARARYTDYMG